MYVRTYIQTYTHTHTYTHRHTYIHTHIHTYPVPCTLVFRVPNIYAYIYMHREREREREQRNVKLARFFLFGGNTQTSSWLLYSYRACAASARRSEYFTGTQLSLPCAFEKCNIQDPIVQALDACQ